MFAQPLWGVWSNSFSERGRTHRTTNLHGVKLAGEVALHLVEGPLALLNHRVDHALVTRLKLGDVHLRSKECEDEPRRLTCGLKLNPNPSHWPRACRDCCAKFTSTSGDAAIPGGWVVQGSTPRRVPGAAAVRARSQGLRRQTAAPRWQRRWRVTLPTQVRGALRGAARQRRSRLRLRSTPTL